MRFQLDSCNLSSETDMAGAAAAADAVAFPPGYLTLLPPVCCLLPAACAPVPHCVSFYATLFVCLLRVSLFYLDLCSVTGTRWYSENASQCGKFVSFSTRQIGWPTSSSSSSASCRRQQLCRNLCAWIVGQLLLGHNSLAAPPPSLPAYSAGFVCDSCALLTNPELGYSPVYCAHGNPHRIASFDILEITINWSRLSLPNSRFHIPRRQFPSQYHLQLIINY